MKFAITCCLLLMVSSCYKVKEETTIASHATPVEYRWKSPFQSVHFEVDLPETQTDDALAMINAWNNTSLARNFLISEGVAYKTSFISLEAITFDKKNTIYLVKQTDLPSKSQTALAVTVLMGRVNKYKQYIIEEADILIREDVLTKYDSKTIILHELGHLLGVQHTSSKSSVMYPFIDEKDRKHTPTEMDVKILASIYNIPYGAVAGKAPRQERDLDEGSGELMRMIFELSADKNCRHFLNGELIGSHQM